jgi:hypothetical protein
VAPVILKVDSYGGYSDEQEPYAFVLGGRRLLVTEIVDRWLSTGYSYFKVRTDDATTCILRHDENAGHWELILFQASQK